MQGGGRSVARLTGFFGRHRAELDSDAPSLTHVTKGEKCKEAVQFTQGKRKIGEEREREREKKEAGREEAVCLGGIGPRRRTGRTELPNLGHPVRTLLLAWLSAAKQLHTHAYEGEKRIHIPGSENAYLSYAAATATTTATAADSGRFGRTRAQEAVKSQHKRFCLSGFNYWGASARARARATAGAGAGARARERKRSNVLTLSDK